MTPDAAFPHIAATGGVEVKPRVKVVVLWPCQIGVWHLAEAAKRSRQSLPESRWSVKREPLRLVARHSINGIQVAGG